MTIKEKFSQRCPHTSPCTFGDSAALADHLATLTATGVKTASCSLLARCIEDNAFPVIGKYKIIRNSRGEPVCVTRMIGLHLLRLSDVAVELARKEDEGDLSLEYWHNGRHRFPRAEGSYLPEMGVISEEYTFIDVVQVTTYLHEINSHMQNIVNFVYLAIFYMMSVTLIIAARLAHIYNHIFNNCLKQGCLFYIEIFESSYSPQHTNLGEHFLTTLQWG